MDRGSMHVGGTLVVFGLHSLRRVLTKLRPARTCLVCTEVSLPTLQPLLRMRLEARDTGTARLLPGDIGLDGTWAVLKWEWAYSCFGVQLFWRTILAYCCLGVQLFWGEYRSSREECSMHSTMLAPIIRNVAAVTPMTTSQSSVEHGGMVSDVLPLLCNRCHVNSPGINAMVRYGKV